MGFRMRRSVKLLPGVRMNFGMRGTSLSIGGRGATVNFSSRGTRTTLGIPGTGLSYTTTSSAGARRPSVRQLEAAARREELARRRAMAEAAVAAEVEEQRAVVDRWRDVPPIPGDSDWEELLGERPFVPEAPAPAGPEEERERARYLSQRIDETVRTLPLFGGSRKFMPLAALLPAPVAWPFEPAAGLMLLVAGTCVGAALPPLLRRREAARLVGETFAPSWQARWAELQASHAAQLAAYEEAIAPAREQWHAEELARIELVRRHLAGDPPTVEATLADALGSLSFPFETECHVWTDDGRTAFVAVDLPEIEDVVPETAKRVLRDGSIKEVKRSQRDRAEEWGQLAAGLGVLIAWATFAAAPTIGTVRVAAFTQRRKRRSGEISDDWVYEVELPRSVTDRIDPRTVQPLDVLRTYPSRFDLRASGELAAIEPPAWAE
jgi:hypothetical protein